MLLQSICILNIYPRAKALLSTRQYWQISLKNKASQQKNQEKISTTFSNKHNTGLQALAALLQSCYQKIQGKR